MYHRVIQIVRRPADADKPARRT